MADTTKAKDTAETPEDAPEEAVAEAPAEEVWSGWVPSLQGAYQPKNTVL